VASDSLLCNSTKTNIFKCRLCTTLVCLFVLVFQCFMSVETVMVSDTYSLIADFCIALHKSCI